MTGLHDLIFPGPAIVPPGVVVLAVQEAVQTPGCAVPIFDARVKVKRRSAQNKPVSRFKFLKNLPNVCEKREHS